MQEYFLLIMDTKSLFYYENDILGNIIIETCLNDTNSDLTSIKLETFMTYKNKSGLNAKLIN